jgi:hypothetical protein
MILVLPKSDLDPLSIALSSDAKGGSEVYCPVCGNQSSMDQNYCRACGLSLEALSGVDSFDGLEIARKQHQRLAARRMMRLLSAGGIVLFAGLALIVVDRKLINDAAVGMAALLTMLVGLVIMAFGLFCSFSHANNRQVDRHTTGAGGRLVTPETRKLSPGAQSLSPVNSVFDKTTGLLNAEATPRKTDPAEF